MQQDQIPLVCLYQSNNDLNRSNLSKVVSVIASFFLDMSIYPEVQQNAQKEIDRVVGSERLPNVKDRDKLPYIDALAKETLRWKPVVPMALPHTNTADDIFHGYFIPKGTTVLPNVWYVFPFQPIPF